MYMIGHRLAAEGMGVLLSSPVLSVLPRAGLKSI